MFFSVNFTGDEDKIGTTEDVSNQTITWAAADNKYSSGEWRQKVKLGMLFKLLYWYKKSFDRGANCIKFNVPAEAVERVSAFIDDQNHFHRIFNENYELNPECTDKLYLSGIWEKIQYDNTYKALSIKVKKRFGRKAFDEWLGNAFTIELDSKNKTKYVVGIKER